MKLVGLLYAGIVAGLAFSSAVSAAHLPTARDGGAKAGKVAPTVYRGAGTVTRVVRDIGAVMIAHDPVAELSWPAMNMTFGVRSDALLESMEPGDRIDFLFVKSGESYIITATE